MKTFSTLINLIALDKLLKIEKTQNEGGKFYFDKILNFENNLFISM